MLTQHEQISSSLVLKLKISKVLSCKFIPKNKPRQTVQLQRIKCTIFKRDRLGEEICSSEVIMGKGH